MEKDEVVALIGEQLTGFKKEMEASIGKAIKAALKDVSGVSKEDAEALAEMKVEEAIKKLNISGIVNKEMEAVKEKLGVSEVKRPKAKPNPDFEPPYEEYVETPTGSKGIMTLKPQLIVLMPTEANAHHEQGVKFTAGGPTATQLIKRGQATYVEVYKEPKKVSAK